jgi:hypothetical protein
MTTKKIAILGAVILATGIAAGASVYLDNHKTSDKPAPVYVDAVTPIGTAGSGVNLKAAQADIDHLLRNSYECFNYGDMPGHLAGYAPTFRWIGSDGKQLNLKQLTQIDNVSLSSTKNARVSVDVTKLIIREGGASVSYQKNLTFDTQAPAVQCRSIDSCEDQLEKRAGKWKLIGTYVISEQQHCTPLEKDDDD